MFVAFFRLCLRTFSWFTSLCVTCLVLLFVIDNTSPVELSFWPLSVAMSAPLWLLTLVLFALGVCFGGFVVWMTSLPHRRAARINAREALALRGRLDDLSREAARAAVPENGDARPRGDKIPVALPGAGDSR